MAASSRFEGGVAHRPMRRCAAIHAAAARPPCPSRGAAHAAAIRVDGGGADSRPQPHAGADTNVARPALHPCASS
jgi:hypothetical protein